MNGKNGKPEPSVNVGEMFGRLTIVKDLGVTNHVRFVIARCECGKCSKYRFQNLRHNNTKSCGCFRVEMSSKTKYNHGVFHDKLYNIWSNMKGRCYNKNLPTYDLYGGRGIKVCDEWVEDFKSFYDWSIKNGYEYKNNRGCQLDRIDNGGDYTPLNCRWVSSKVNNNNRRNNIFFEYNGAKKTFSEWCDILGLNYKLSHQRMRKNNMSFETLVTRFSGEIKHGLD